MISQRERNLICARMAIREALAFTPDGSTNKGAKPTMKRHGLGPKPDRAFASMFDLRSYRDQLRTERGLANSSSRLNDIMLLSQAARTMGFGNCQEQAAVAFAHLYQRGVRPVDFMGFDATGYCHAWVVIGRTAGDSRELGSWGPEAVWCDPWGAPQGLCFVFQRVFDGCVVGKNELHHAIRSANGKPIVLTADVIRKGLPTVRYRSQ